MKGYKGFNRGLVCRGKQYEENTVFEEAEAVICEKGMHFCKDPFDVLDHYPLVNREGNFSDFAEVEALDECYTNDEKKYCTKKLKIGAKLSFGDFVKACVDFIIEKTSDSSSGNYARIVSSGDDARIGSSGNHARIGSSGVGAQIGSSGDYAQIGSSGVGARIGSSGDYAQIKSEGEDSVICCAGLGCIAKAKKGSWITLAEWKYSDEKERYVPVCVKTEYVDGERIKSDTFYKLENGEFVEAE